MPTHPASRREILLQFLVLSLLLLAAGYFRFTGLMWGDYEYPHPDERFLVWVVADIAPVENAAQYFDTAVSTLNPANRNHTFYVYGDFPVILTRYVAEEVFDSVGWQEILQVGRGLSAFLDLLTVLLVFVIGRRIAGWKAGALAGAFSAAAVLQIQQAHFFASDSFAVFFTTLSITLGVLIATEPDDAPQRRVLWLSLLYGAAVGLAMACKINTAPVAVLLPLALGARWLRRPREEQARAALRLAGCALAGGIAALLVFRVAMPYAFSGPGFFDVSIDARWLASMKDLSAQSSGDVDSPPALQWVRRNHLFSLKNMTLWGLGIPLSAAAWAGFFVLAWRAVERIFAARRARDGADGPPVQNSTVQFAALRALADPAFSGALLVGLWTGAYFLWQSLAWNPTMRYQLPIYPTLCVLAGWGAGSLWERLGGGQRRWGRAAVAVPVGLALMLTLAWAFAFTRIYTRTETRVEASRWILENVPAPLNLEGTSGEDGQPWRQMLPLPGQVRVTPSEPYLLRFTSGQAAQPYALSLPPMRFVALGQSSSLLTAQIVDPRQPEAVLWRGEANIGGTESIEQMELPLAGETPLEAGRQYLLTIAVEWPGGAQAGGEPVLVANLNGEISLSLYGRSRTVEYTVGGAGAAGGAEASLGQADDLLELSLPEGGTLRRLRVKDGAPVSGATVFVADAATGEQRMSLATPGPFGAADGTPPALQLNPPLEIEAGKRMLLAVVSSIPGRALEPGQTLALDLLDEPLSQMMPAATQPARSGSPLWVIFNSNGQASLQKVTLGHAAQIDPQAGTAGVALAVYDGSNPTRPLGVAKAQVAPPQGGDPRGGEVVFTFDTPVALAEGVSYNISLTPDAGAVVVRGSAPANETSWDLSLPFRLDGYDPYGGLYRNDLNFEMYWDDNADKLSRMVNILDQADYLFLSSNRQWGTTTRAPERYPLTTKYYRELLGCPAEQEVLDCYNAAEVGDYEGRLGFDLVRVVTSYPNLGPLEINTQYAEEAFTVYDHPKVFIFQKRAGYDPAAVRAVLGQVDLGKVVHVTPRKAADYKDLLLPAKLWAAQQAGGTWAELFPPEGLLNRFPALAAAAYYLFLLALGLAAYPAVRLALPALPDRGYPLARTAGMVVLAFIAWAAGSLGLPVTRPLLALIFAGLVGLGGGLAWLQRSELREDWRQHRGYLLRVELAALGLFALFLAVRLGNPDLWHPIFGGEKPMDFSYFNAVLKSTVFPPYDPWFAGGYINYYYYGFVLVGMPVKLLGIDPTVAYNLILPGLFMLVGLGAWSVGANLFAAGARAQDDTGGLKRRGLYGAALAAVLALLILGNLGTVRMYWRGLQKLVTAEENITAAGPFQQTAWVVEGLGKLARGEAVNLPYYPGDWYWKPSRAIQPESGNEITEFPAFTFLYADLHAHLMALPVTVLVIGWSVGVLLGAGRWGSGGRYRRLSFALALLLGAMAAGMLRPANTWDQYTYLTLAALALFAGQSAARNEGGPRRGPAWLWSPTVSGLLAAGALVALALLLYRPFDAWFAQGYNAVELWQGAKTGLSSYLVHWGLFLFVIAAWLADETIDWMAATPLSSLAQLRPYTRWIAGLGAALIVGVIVLAATGVSAALIAGPLGVWAALLLARPGQPAARRAVLFMTGSALALTLGVELVAVKGDIGRMNTVFKFYYQAWTLFSLSAAAALAWLWEKLPRWAPRARALWQVALWALVFGAALFPLAAGRAKIADRMTPAAPHVLDGMEYMNYSGYVDGPSEESSAEMDLSQDYRAIRWVQANVPGSPVIVEANTPEYRHWGTRFTIYTGLPGVVGWNWHQRQQRTVTPDTWVYERIEAVGDFYKTTSREQAAAFLARYNAGYVILGQLERLYYAGPGLDKFAQLEGELWEKVYEDGPTVIYRVIGNGE